MNISRTFPKRAAVAASVLLIAFCLISTTNAQTSSIDLSFSAVPNTNVTTPTNFILQPDDKIIAFGDFQVVRGVIKNRVARFNPDGSVDNTFNCAICDFSVKSAALQPDGKIIVAGNTSVQYYYSSVIYRLNADGSRDESFSSPFSAVNFPNSASAEVKAVQPDGKILILLFSSQSNTYGSSLYRLNNDGTFDSSFATITVASGSGGTFGQNPGKISLLPNGKILVVTNSFANCPGCAPGSGLLKRYNADGTADSSFESPRADVENNYNGSATIEDFAVQSDGSVIIVGKFLTVNGVSRANIAKILLAGNVDLSFNSSLSGEIIKVKILSDGKILLASSSRIYRLNTDGNLDNSFVSPSNITSIYNLMLDSAGKIVLHALFSENGVPVNEFTRLSQNGGIESSFEPNFGVFGSIAAVAAQPDGKIVFSGDFLRINDVPSVSPARVNADGSLDPTFNPGTGVSGSVSKILIQADGKILLAGSFYAYNGTSRSGLIRLNTDGSLDGSFNPTISFISYVSVSIALQNDGKIIVTGNFNAINGQARTGIARLNTDGSLDAGFNPAFGSYSNLNVFAQPDGKILVGGNFSGVNGFNRQNLARLNADGTLDSSFNAAAGNSVSSSGVTQIEEQTNGKYLILTGNTIVRLNSDGTTDSTFSSPVLPQSDNSINRFLVLPDNSILVGGSFSQINSVSRSNLARLQPNGALDTTFFPTGANGAIRTIVSQADGKIIVGGDFSSIGGVTRLGIARLTVAPIRAQSTLFDFDGDGRADIAVFRPANGFWYQLRSQNNAFNAFQFGQASDQLAPADYDGDGRTDLAVFRDSVPGAGDKAYFYITSSSDNSFHPVQFGTQNDLPVSGDWDGDGKADLAVYRRAASVGGQSYFLYRPSSIANADFTAIAWGTAGDKPVVGDFDGDGKLDAAVFRPSNAVWYILKSSNNQVIQQPFGLATDIPAAADYDGDGVTNIAVFRPSNGYWYTSTNPQTNYGGVQFGQAGDVPAAADYDGDGKADEAVYRPATGAWYVRRSTAGFYGVQFGAADDRPVPHSFIR